MSRSKQKKGRRVAIKDAELKHADPKGGVAVGDVNLDGRDSAIERPAGGGPHVKVFSGSSN